MPPLRSRIADSFARQGLMKTLGARLEDVAPGRATITAPIGPQTGQQHGFAHAGMTFSLGDTAAGYTALSLMPEGAEVLTAEIKINLLAPGVGTMLRATGRVIKPGRRLIVAAADVHAIDEDGRETLIAVLQGTMVPG